MSDNQFLTQNVKVAEAKNHHCANSLQKELSRLDHDHQQRMRQLNQEELQFRDTLTREGSSLGTSRPSSGKSSITTHSPKPVRNTSLGQKGSPQNLQDETGSQANVQIVISSSGPVDGNADGKKQRTRKISIGSQLGKTNGSPSGVNSGSPTLARRHSIQSSHNPASPNMARRGSYQAGNSGTGSPFGSRRGSVDSAASDVAALTQSFGHLSPGRPRSNSLAGSAALPLPPHKPQRRLSLCPAVAARARECPPNVLPEYHRSRSSSFSGVEPVRRRGSICERFGSVSEREVPRGHDHRRREHITGMDHLIRDLGYGIHHRELLRHDGSAPAQGPELWQELKNCRYLRMPSEEQVD